MSRELASRRINSCIPPLVLSVLMESVARSLACETELNVSFGHVETEAFVELWLQQLEEAMPR